MKRIIGLLLCVAVLTTIWGVRTAAARIEGKEIAYTVGDATLKGYLAWNPALKGKLPGVLVVHEWWGHNEYARNRARMLAELGYVAFAVDMYGNGAQAQHPEEAGMLAAMINKNRDTAAERFNAAIGVLKQQANVDPTRLAAIGYCFGGGVVLNMAREGIPLKGVASFHGSLATDTPAMPGAIKAKIFVANGGADTFSPPQMGSAFVDEMMKAGVDFRFYNYPGAKHSFTNPAADDYAKRFGLNVAYHAAADRRSWDDLKNFLREIFSP